MKYNKIMQYSICLVISPGNVFCLTDKEAVQQFEARIKSERKEQNDKVKMIFKFNSPKVF